MLYNRLCPCLVDKKSNAGASSLRKLHSFVIAFVVCLQEQCKIFKVINIICGIPMKNIIDFASGQSVTKVNN